MYEMLRISNNGNAEFTGAVIAKQGIFQVLTNSPEKAAGYATDVGFRLLSANGLYGFYMGISSAGHTWMQVGRNDGDTTLYDLKIQALGGNTYFGGSVTAAGGGFNSRREIKNIHKDWGGNALNVISKFKIRDFNYKTRPDYDRTLGFIIDEIPEEIGDYALSGTNRDAVNTYTLHGLSFLAHQETKTEIEILKERIKILEGRLN